MRELWAQKKAGRPKEFKERVELHFSLEGETRQLLEKIAAVRQISVAELVRTYLEWGLETDVELHYYKQE